MHRTSASLGFPHDDSLLWHFVNKSQAFQIENNIICAVNVITEMGESFSMGKHKDTQNIKVTDPVKESHEGAIRKSNSTLFNSHPGLPSPNPSSQTSNRHEKQHSFILKIVYPRGHHSIGGMGYVFELDQLFILLHICRTLFSSSSASNKLFISVCVWRLILISLS